MLSDSALWCTFLLFEVKSGVNWKCNLRFGAAQGHFFPKVFSFVILRQSNCGAFFNVTTHGCELSINTRQPRQTFIKTSLWKVWFESRIKGYINRMFESQVTFWLFTAGWHDKTRGQFGNGVMRSIWGLIGLLMNSHYDVMGPKKFEECLKISKHQIFNIENRAKFDWWRLKFYIAEIHITSSANCPN